MTTHVPRILLPDVGDSTYSLSCPLCSRVLDPDEPVHVLHQGLLQVNPGEDALPVLDQTFICPACHAISTIRFSDRKQLAAQA